jgi:hypothetical protein
MAKARKGRALIPGSMVHLSGDRSAEWTSEAEEGTRHRTEHFRCIDSLGLLLRNGAITGEMHDAGQEFHRIFVIAQMSPTGAPALDRIPGGRHEGSLTERGAWACQRVDAALAAVGGANSPGGCALWHVAGLGRSVREWSRVEGWNGRSLNVYEAKGILVGALGTLAVYYGYAPRVGLGA